MQLKQYITNALNKGHERSIKAKKHIVLSFIYRGLDLGLGLILIPLLIEYLDETRYGIWLVFLSLTTYFNFLDIGLEQGLRNKLTEYKAKGKVNIARIYVSTSYAIIAIIAIAFFTIFIIVNPLLNWNTILNTNTIAEKELSLLALFIFGSFSLIFILKIVITIAVADQKPSILNQKNVLEKIFKFIFVLILIATIPSSLLILGIGYSIIPVLVLIGYSFYFFLKKYKNLRPSIKYVNFSYLKDLLNLGFQFFIISIAVIILFTTDNLIITQLFGPKYVTDYEIAHKYFSIPYMLFLLIVQPFWSAVTEAYTLKEYKWIKNTIKKLRVVWIIFSFGLVIMLLISPFIYRIWLGDSIKIPFTLSINWCILILVQTYSSIYTSFINGIGKLRIQVITAIISIIINIPLSILFAKTLKMGNSGVALATVICMINGLIFRQIQYNKTINNKASGIWAK